MLNLLTEGTLAPVLIFGYGNPARGDDGLGPRFIELMQPWQEHAQFDTLTDYQLQVEHSLDLEHRRQVIFIDASVSSPAPFEFSPVLPARDDSYTSHAMSPPALLAVYEQVCDRNYQLQAYSVSGAMSLSLARPSVPRHRTTFIKRSDFCRNC